MEGLTCLAGPVAPKKRTRSQEPLPNTRCQTLSVTRLSRDDALTSCGFHVLGSAKACGSDPEQEGKDGGGGRVSWRAGYNIAQAPGELGICDRRDRG